MTRSVRSPKRETRLIREMQEEAERVKAVSEWREREKSKRLAKAKAKFGKSDKDRIEASESRGVRADFVVRDESDPTKVVVFCRYCGTVIAVDGRARSNFRNVEIPLDNGATLSSNGCVDCVEKLDTTSSAVLEDVVVADVVAWALADESEGRREFPTWRPVAGPRRVTKPGDE